MRIAHHVIALILSGVLTLFVALFVAPLQPWENDAGIVAMRAQFDADLAALRADPLPLDGLPVLTGGVMALEDRGYADRPVWIPPVSPSGFARAVWLNLKGVRAGGSTIPQQLAKLYVRDGAADLDAKLRELAFATWMGRRASRGEILSLYLNLSCGSALGGAARDPVHGLETFVLAYTRQPLAALSADDQLLVAAVPWGLARMRREGEPAVRLRAAHDWLVAEGRWPEDATSNLAEILTLGTRDLYTLSDAWRPVLATHAAGSSDFDLALAADAFTRGLRAELDKRFPGTEVATAFAAVGPDGVVARSGLEAGFMLVNYGSIAKLQLLHEAVALLGVEEVHTRKLAPAPCVRWAWNGRLVGGRGRWCPSDTDAPGGPMALDEAVARSLNTPVARHAVSIPYRLRLASLGGLDAMGGAAPIPATESDRILSANLLGELGHPVPADQIPDQLAYTAVEQAWFRHLHEQRAALGLSLPGLPQDVTQLVGNSSRATTEQLAAYGHRVLFAGDGTCTLSDTGSLLAAWRDTGTLRWLAGKRRSLVFTGKTGSSPANDAAVAILAVCLDDRPIVLAGALRAVKGELPKGLHGSVVLRGHAAWLDEVEALERRVGDVRLSPAVEALLAPPEQLVDLATLGGN